MACIRKRRGKWVVDYRDSAGLRRWVTCPTRREAEDVLEEKRRESRQRGRPVVDPNITVAAYAERWLRLTAAHVKPITLAGYDKVLRRHLVPGLGPLRVRHLHRGQLKALLADKLAAGLARKTVQFIHATLRAMLGAAVDDGVLLANPATRLGQQLRLVSPPRIRQEEIKAMTRAQLHRFLTVAATAVPRLAPLLLLLARTGLRLGEAIALQWEDLNVPARELRVARTLSAGRMETPKSGHGRTVELSDQVTAALTRLALDRKREALRRGWREVPPWVFVMPTGSRLIPRTVEGAFKRVLAAAGLPLHFTPHGLRHTFASLLLQAGVSPLYVQRQLGHASIRLTVDVYGRWLPLGDQGAVSRLDDPSGSKTVAAPAGRAAQVLDSSEGSEPASDDTPLFQDTHQETPP